MNPRRNYQQQRVALQLKWMYNIGLYNNMHVNIILYVSAINFCPIGVQSLYTYSRVLGSLARTTGRDTL